MSSSTGFITSTVGRVSAAVAAVAALAAGAIAVPAVTGGAGGATITCNQTAANSTQLSTAITAASAGQTVCLTVATSYGTFAGTNKAITIIAQSGTGAPNPVNATMALNLGNGDTSFTLDGGRATWAAATGLTITGADLLQTPGPQNITIKNARLSDNNASGVGGLVEVDGPTNTGIVFDHVRFTAIGGDNGSGCSPPSQNSCVEAAMRFSYDGPSGVTVQNSLFDNMAADGMKVGASNTTILNSAFVNVKPDNANKHTDAIQLCCGYTSASNAGSGGLTIRGNFIKNCEQAIGAFDGTGANTITNNVVVSCTAHSLVVGGDATASTLDHNTVWGDSTATVDCTSKAGSSASRTNITNNVAQGGLELTGTVNCNPTSNTHNVFSGASSPNISGTATFVNSASPQSFADMCLTSGSVGFAGASDGTQVGACGGSYTGRPPETF